MLKDIIKENGYSVYKVSKESGVPYTTCNEIVLGKKNIEDCSIKTIASLASYLNVPLESLFKSKKQKISSSWLEAKDKRYIFPIVIDDAKYEAARIHPLNQKAINNIYDVVSVDHRILKVIVFGSSTTIRCNRNSDVDIAIELADYSNEIKNEISEKIQEVNNYNTDIIWLDRVKSGSNIVNNINKGVTIYEQTIS